MKKAFGQTVRDIKREVNKKVLKVPGIEQKVLDATSNEAWGPHGSHLADIAQATRNYHEYQMIMSVLWKRINDTGKNWRHVYKALTVLDYLVAHGSERVIDEIREHAYQISTLSDFQYIDSSGRDQGSNVRKKSQSLVALVNDKERVQEVRQKASANKDKFRGASSTGGMYRPSSYSSTGGYGDRYDDDRYEGRNGNRDEDRNGYGRERDWGNRDEDRYGRGGDSYGRDGDRYGRDPDERYSRDDDYRGNRNGDDYQFGSRNRSFDKDKDRSYEDDDRYSSRSGGGRADEHIQDERRFERKLSENSRPPSYEEAVSDAQNHIQDERDGDPVATLAPKASSPPQNTVQGEPTNKEINDFDEFDPRGSVSAAPPAASSAEMDFFGSFSDSVSPNALALALVPVETATTTSETAPPPNSSFGTTFVPLSSASNVVNQPGDDPFGDGPFRAIPQDNLAAQPQNFTPMTSFQPTLMSRDHEHLQPATQQVETVPGFDFGDTFPGITYAPSNIANVQIPSATPEFSSPQFSSPQLLSSQPSNDILGNLLPQSGPTASIPSEAAALVAPIGPSIAPIPSQAYLAAPTGPPIAPIPSQAALAAPTGPPANVQPPKDKFEPKSTVWADTLNRGLVNLNISGPKINPLADIGIDFESMNRKERREDRKSSATPATSTITMGKAMGSGSGIGRAGASGIVPPPNAMVVSGMGMGMGMGGASMGGMGMGGGASMGGMGMGMGGGAGMGMGMGSGNVPGVGMGGYGALNQPMGMGMNMPMGMGMGMNMPMGMGQGGQMRPSTQMPPSAMGMPSGYNPMMGMGGYAPQQPYGGYR